MNFFIFRIPGGIYMHQGNGGQGDNPWPKARVRPRPYSRGNSAQAAFSRPCQGGARLASRSVSSYLSPARWKSQFLDLTPWADKISSLRSMGTW